MACILCKTEQKVFIKNHLDISNKLNSIFCNSETLSDSAKICISCTGRIQQLHSFTKNFMIRTHKIQKTNNSSSITSDDGSCYFCSSSEIITEQINLPNLLKNTNIVQNLNVDIWTCYSCFNLIELYVSFKKILIEGNYWNSNKREVRKRGSKRKSNKVIEPTETIVTPGQPVELSPNIKRRIRRREIDVLHVSTHFYLNSFERSPLKDGVLNTTDPITTRQNFRLATPQLESPTKQLDTSEIVNCDKTSEEKNENPAQPIEGALVDNGLSESGDINFQLNEIYKRKFALKECSVILHRIDEECKDPECDYTYLKFKYKKSAIKNKSVRNSGSTSSQRGRKNKINLSEENNSKCTSETFVEKENPGALLITSTPIAISDSLEKTTEIKIPNGESNNIKPNTKKSNPKSTSKQQIIDAGQPLESKLIENHVTNNKLEQNTSKENKVIFTKCISEIVKSKKKNIPEVDAKLCDTKPNTYLLEKRDTLNNTVPKNPVVKKLNFDQDKVMELFTKPVPTLAMKVSSSFVESQEIEMPSTSVVIPPEQTQQGKRRPPKDTPENNVPRGKRVIRRTQKMIESSLNLKETRVLLENLNKGKEIKITNPKTSQNLEPSKLITCDVVFNDKKDKSQSNCQSEEGKVGQRRSNRRKNCKSLKSDEIVLKSEIQEQEKFRGISVQEPAASNWSNESENQPRVSGSIGNNETRIRFNCTTTSKIECSLVDNYDYNFVDLSISNIKQENTLSPQLNVYEDNEDEGIQHQHNTYTFENLINMPEIFPVLDFSNIESNGAINLNTPESIETSNHAPIKIKLPKRVLNCTSTAVEKQKKSRKRCRAMREKTNCDSMAVDNTTNEVMDSSTLIIQNCSENNLQLKKNEHRTNDERIEGELPKKKSKENRDANENKKKIRKKSTLTKQSRVLDNVTLKSDEYFLKKFGIGNCFVQLPKVSAKDLVQPRRYRKQKNPKKHDAASLAKKLKEKKENSPTNNQVPKRKPKQSKLLFKFSSKGLKPVKHPKKNKRTNNGNENLINRSFVPQPLIDSKEDVRKLNELDSANNQYANGTIGNDEGETEFNDNVNDQAYSLYSDDDQHQLMTNRATTKLSSNMTQDYQVSIAPICHNNNIPRKSILKHSSDDNRKKSHQRMVNFNDNPQIIEDVLLDVFMNDVETEVEIASSSPPKASDGTDDYEMELHERAEPENRETGMNDHQIYTDYESTFDTESESEVVQRNDLIQSLYDEDSQADNPRTPAISGNSSFSAGSIMSERENLNVGQTRQIECSFYRIPDRNLEFIDQIQDDTQLLADGNNRYQ